MVEPAGVTCYAYNYQGKMLLYQIFKTGTYQTTYGYNNSGSYPSYATGQVAIGAPLHDLQ